MAEAHCESDSEAQFCLQEPIQPLHKAFAGFDCAFWGGLRHEHHKFVSSITSNYVRDSHGWTQHCFGEISQDTVSGEVAVAIVDYLKVVKVQHENGHALAVSKAAGHLFCEPV